MTGGKAQDMNPREFFINPADYGLPTQEELVAYRQPFNFAAYVKMLVAHHHNFTLLWQTELPTFRNLPTQATNSPDFTVTPQPWPCRRAPA